jgi:hypothetical protein
VKKSKRRKAARSKTIIHVDPNTLRRNRENGENEPAVLVIRDNDDAPVKRVHSATWSGRSKLVTSNEPLATGATAWVETDGPVRTRTEKKDGEYQAGFFRGCG